MRVEAWQRKDGKWAWHAVEGSDIVAGDENQGYENEADCVAEAKHVTKEPVVHIVERP